MRVSRKVSKRGKKIYSVNVVEETVIFKRIFIRLRKFGIKKRNSSEVTL